MKDKLDQIRGSLMGGAIGDALGYPVEFFGEDDIIRQYGKDGIQSYALDSKSGKALVSDDTQMTLFTANGILVAETDQRMQGSTDAPHVYIRQSYQDWFDTQTLTFEEAGRQPKGRSNGRISWLSEVPELYSRRAPGNTCMSALMQQRSKKSAAGDLSHPQNNSKGCGGIMRVAPLALKDYGAISMEKLDVEAAEIAAITHGHSLGYMPAAVLVHIIHRILYPEKELTLREIVLEARDTIAGIFSGDAYLPLLIDIINRAAALSESDGSDQEHIHRLGEGWVAEETLGIAIYCALRYPNDFSAGVAAAVNHCGDSDSTGAVTGNILGAWIGYEAIDSKWKEHLELKEVILELADDLGRGCRLSASESCADADWQRKYIDMQWRKGND